MKKRLAFLLLGLGIVLLAAGQLAHANLAPAPNDIEDALPQWSADGSRLAWNRTAPGMQHVVTMSSSGANLYVASFGGHFRGYVPTSAPGPYLLIEGNEGVTVLTVGGRYSGPRATLHGTDASASPDGTRAAYLRDGTLYVARIDNLPPNLGITPSPSVETPVATGIAPSADDVVGPAWSPDGTRIAVASGSSLVVARADGSGSRVVATSASPIDNPSWSYDGRRLAFEVHAQPNWQVWLAGADGSGAVAELVGSQANYRFPQFSPVDTQLTYISDKQHVRGGATPYQYALYTYDTAKLGTTQKLLDDVHPYSPARWQPGGGALAVAAGQECLRWGVYVVQAKSLHRHRLSNICRFDGTRGADTIHASPYFDILNGFGGNDTLYGYRGNDKILGENGNDVLLGQDGNDVIFGGPGDDVIFGGPGNDTIIGGNGHDRIDCGPGTDTVEGAGPLDRIAANCEHVRR